MWTNDLEKENEHLHEKIKNLEAYIDRVYKEFIEYIDHNPKVDEQWAEERLRALEEWVKLSRSNNER